MDAATRSKTIRISLLIKDGQIIEVIADDDVDISRLTTKESKQFAAGGPEVAYLDTILMKKLGKNCYVKIDNKKIRVPCPSTKR